MTDDHHSMTTRPVYPIQRKTSCSIEIDSSDETETKERMMSIQGKIEEATGFVKEEAFEHGTSPERKKAQEGRYLRNEGRIEDGAAPKASTPAPTQK